jgi:Ca-activated chloride channel family protein
MCTRPVQGENRDGADADLASLERISAASRAAAYDATDPLTIDSVFTNVLSNF